MFIYDVNHWDFIHSQVFEPLLSLIAEQILRDLPWAATQQDVTDC